MYLIEILKCKFRLIKLFVLRKPRYTKRHRIIPIMEFGLANVKAGMYIWVDWDKAPKSGSSIYTWITDCICDSEVFSDYKPRMITLFKTCNNYHRSVFDTTICELDNTKCEMAIKDILGVWYYYEPALKYFYILTDDYLGD